MNTEPKTMKAWYVFEGKPEWYHANLLLENGAAPYGHLCSHPAFMPGDLWLHRPERQGQMARAGITLDIQNNGEPVRITTLPELIALNGKFRSLLMEVWDDALPILPWCLLNPSIAGEELADGEMEEDPTWKKGRGFSTRLGYGGQVFVNPWAYVATDFADLKRAGYPFSPTNDAYILEACAMGDGKVMVAWGRNGKGLSRPLEVLAMIRKAGYQTMALAVTQDGLPGHPLMLPYTCQPTPYP